MAQSDREKAVIAAFYDTMQKLVGSEKDLNGLHVKGIAQMQKSMNETEVNTKKIKQQTLAVKASLEATLDDNVTKIKSIKLNEKLIKLRNRNALEQIREQGEQVRRNIKLRAGNEKFSASLALASKSLTGGFGFQAGISTTIQGFAQLTKKFNNLKYATEDLSKSHKRTAQLKLERDGAVLNQMFGSGSQQKTDEAEEDYKTSQQKTARNLSTAIDAKNEEGIEQKGLKGVFSKLSGLGEFLSKKAVPIGIGMGVAGILMSVIVKSFSASPLFAAMMKMMKFMVTLILMPIGTFFGALLRPILVMLLRKFIIPFYSNWMPKMMAWGTALGNWLSGESGQKTTAQPIPTELVPTKEQLDKEAEERYVSLTERIWNGLVNGIWDQITKGNVNVSTLSVGSIVMPQAFADDTEYVPTEEDVSVPDDDPLKTSNLPTGDSNDTRTNEERLADDLDGKMIDTIPTTIPFDRTKENTEGEMFPWLQGGGNTGTIPESTGGGWGDGEGLPDYVNPVTAPEVPREMTEAEKDRKLMITDPRAWQAKQDKIRADKKKAQQEKWMLEAEAKALKQKQDEETKARLTAALSKPSSGYDRFEAQAARNAEQEKVDVENTRFYGTGKLTRTTNAGANVGAADAKNKSKGHVNLSQSNMNLSQATRDLLASMNSGVIPAANGFDGMVNKPTMFMAGESGAEHVKVTPNGQGGGGSNITVNIQNMNAGDDDLRKLKKTILEVIQQSSANRGRL